MCGPPEVNIMNLKSKNDYTFFKHFTQNKRRVGSILSYNEWYNWLKYILVHMPICRPRPNCCDISTINIIPYKMSSISTSIKTSQDIYLSYSLNILSDRQTDRYFIDRNKSHYRLICHSNKRDICTCIYKNVSLLKSYESIYIV